MNPHDRRSGLWCVTLLGAALAAACGPAVVSAAESSSPPPAAVRLVPKETVLGTIPLPGQTSDEELKSETLGDARSTRPMIAVTADGKRLAYAVRSKGEGEFVVVDGVKGKVYTTVSGLQASADGQHVAYVAIDVSSQRLVLDGVEQPPQRSVGFRFSPVGHRLAWFAEWLPEKPAAGGAPAAPLTAGRWQVMVDGAAEPPCDGVEFLDFSPDGRHVAYLARRGGKQCMVVDGAAGPLFEKIMARTFAFSPGGKHFIYEARDGQQALAVMDGNRRTEIDRFEKDDLIPIAEWPAMLVAAFSPDGEHVAFTARAPEGEVVLCDGKAGKAYESIEGLTFSPEGNHLAYIAEKSDKQHLVVDDVEHREFDHVSNGVLTGGLVFSPDGHHTAYWGVLEEQEAAGAEAEIGQTYFFMFDGKPFAKTYTGLGTIAFSPDSKRYGFIGLRGKKVCVVVDGEETLWDEASDLAFSADGKHYWFTAKRDGKACAVYDGKAGPPNDWIVPVETSPDNRRIAWVAGRGENTAGTPQWIVIDGVEGRKYDQAAFITLSYILGCPPVIPLVPSMMVGPRFSPDSKHLAYGVVRDGNVRVVVDGEETAAYDGFVRMEASDSPGRRPSVFAGGEPALEFTGPSEVMTVVRRGNQILRLEIQVAAP
jgi:roadblock/LC7 domain-containing protein